MKLFAQKNLVNIFFALAVLACAAAMARPLFFMSDEKRTEYTARQNAIAVNLALTAYSQKHSGIFPADNQIAGGAGDVLTRGKIMLCYPENPYSSGRKIKKVPFGEAAPGDFSYSRDNEKKYEYKLVVYGKRGRTFKYGSKY